jgi:hypothetical protein
MIDKYTQDGQGTYSQFGYYQQTVKVKRVKSYGSLGFYLFAAFVAVSIYLFVFWM